MPARVVALLTATALVLGSQPSFAQPKPGGPGNGLPLIRDSEIEQLLRDYTAPILKVAGLLQQNVKVVLIKEENQSDAEIVDGQQRLTTLTILLAALRHAITEAKFSSALTKYLYQEGDLIEGIAVDGPNFDILPAAE